MAIGPGPLPFPAPEQSLQHDVNQTPKSSCAASADLDQDSQMQGGETTLSLRTRSPTIRALLGADVYYMDGWTDGGWWMDERTGDGWEDGGWTDANAEGYLGPSPS